MIYINFKKIISKNKKNINNQNKKRIKKDFEGYDHMTLMVHQSHDKKLSKSKINYNFKYIYGLKSWVISSIISLHVLIE